MAEPCLCHHPCRNWWCNFLLLHTGYLCVLCKLLLLHDNILSSFLGEELVDETTVNPWSFQGNRVLSLIQTWVLFMQCSSQGVFSGNTSPSPQVLNLCSRKWWKWRSFTSPWLPLVLDLNQWLKWSFPIPRELQSSLWIFLLQGCNWSVWMIYCLPCNASSWSKCLQQGMSMAMVSSGSHLLAVTNLSKLTAAFELM